jgi:hypothetical protein
MPGYENAKTLPLSSALAAGEEAHVSSNVSMVILILPGPRASVPYTSLSGRARIFFLRLKYYSKKAAGPIPMSGGASRRP